MMRGCGQKKKEEARGRYNDPGPVQNALTLHPSASVQQDGGICDKFIVLW